MDKWGKLWHYGHGSLFGGAMTEGHYPYVARIDSRTDKPHKQREDTRTCAEDDCAVRLSKYNTKSSMCYMHVP